MNPRTLEAFLLYRDLIKAANAFRDYNFRMYTLRRTRDEFRAKLPHPELIDDLL
jgi:hypothetical protein